jgi:hypothetical protein
MIRYRPEIEVRDPDGRESSFSDLDDFRVWSKEHKIGSADDGECMFEPGFYITENGFFVFNYDVPTMVGVGRKTRPNDLIEYADTQGGRYVMANRGTKEERLYFQQRTQEAERVIYRLERYSISDGSPRYNIKMRILNETKTQGDLKAIYDLLSAKYGEVGQSWWLSQSNLDEMFLERESQKRIKCLTNQQIYPSISEASKDTEVPVKAISEIIDTQRNYNGFRFIWDQPYLHED